MHTYKDQGQGKAAAVHPTSPILSLDEKRHAVYSSLLRYGTEAVSLRERALDRTVLGALIGSSADEPFRVGTIQKNLSYGPEAPELRVTTIQESLYRLIHLGKVEHRELRKNHAYCLTWKGSLEVTQVINSSEELFRPVLKAILRDTAHEFSFEVGAKIFRKFVYECFARFGHAMAKNVTGHMTHEALLHSTDVEAAFHAAVADTSLTAEAMESMRVRCFGFLRGSDTDAERLKFHLTQGYYFTQLLGFENGKFNPLNEHAFSGAVFYIDTNVLLGPVLNCEENAPLFNEMMLVAKRIGIELRVTRATINEARFVAAGRLPLLRQIVEALPSELVERTNDLFLKSYLIAREFDKELTPEEFLKPFDRLAEIVEEEMHVTIDERTEEEIIAGRDFNNVRDILNRAAIRSRGWGKPEAVLMHDVSQYFVVRDLRRANLKVWFLTLDKTFIAAAPTLDPEDAPFYFQLIGFLHSISPFLTTIHEELPFADTLSNFIEEQVFPIGNLFDAHELALMAEYNEDVMSTPPDLLVKAFDYVKSKTLQGQPYNRSNIPDVSLELKKFLSSSKDDQIRAIEAERERLATESKSERLRRIEAEEERGREREEKEVLRAELDRTLQHVSASSNELAVVQSQLSDQQRALMAREQRSRALFAVAGMIGGLTLWRLSDAILKFLGQTTPILLEWTKAASIGFNVIGALLFSLPAFFFIRRSAWHRNRKIAAYTIVVFFTLILSQLVDKETVSSISDYAGVAGLVVLVVGAALLVEKID